MANDGRDRLKITKIEELERVNPSYKDRLQLLKGILKMRFSYKDRLSIEPLSEDMMKELMAKGKPIGGVTELKIPIEILLEYADELDSGFSEWVHFDGRDFHLGEYLRRCLKDKLDIQLLLEDAKSMGKLPYTMVLETMKPYFEKIKEYHETIFSDSSWLMPYCYVCGGEPDIARIDSENNKRYLCCELCDTLWLYMRLKCPFCGNEDQKSLVILSVENDTTEKYSIHACQKCKRYLKVFNSRPNEIYVLEAESLLSGYLDVIAQNEGFV